MPRLFIIDGAKALSKAIRRTFGRAAAIQRCQIHKARNIMERLPKSLHASVRCVLRQAWELDDAAKAERLLRPLNINLGSDRFSSSTKRRDIPRSGHECRAAMRHGARRFLKNKFGRPRMAVSSPTL